MNKESIALRPLRIDDYEAVLNWSKDDLFCSANGWELERDEVELYNWWSHCVNNEAEDFIRMGIDFDGKLIGYADLANIEGNTAEIGIAIGETTLWGKGIGFHSTLSLIKYASTELRITVFNAETHETNIRSRNMLQRLGFEETSRIGTEEYLGEDSQLIQYRQVRINPEMHA